MKALVDTSLLVRYLTRDPPHLAERAAQVLDGEETLGITEVALVETAYVLESVYGVPRREVVDALLALLQKENLKAVGGDWGRACGAGDGFPRSWSIPSGRASPA